MPLDKRLIVDCNCKSDSWDGQVPTKVQGNTYLSLDSHMLNPKREFHLQDLCTSQTILQFYDNEGTRLVEQVRLCVSSHTNAVVLFVDVEIICDLLCHPIRLSPMNMCCNCCSSTESEMNFC